MTDYNIHAGTPSVAAAADTGEINCATEFYSTGSAWVTQIRFLQPSSGGSAGTRTCAIYSVTSDTAGTMVAGPFTMPAPTAGQWCTYTLITPYSLTPTTRYRVVVHHPAGDYPATSSYFTSSPYDAGNYVQGILTVPNQGNATGSDQGSYKYGALAFTDASFNNTAYYSDVTVSDTAPPSSTHRPSVPGISRLTPAHSAGSAAVVIAVPASPGFSVPPTWGQLWPR